MVTQNPFVQYGKEIWWMILIRGIFGVIFGIIALVWPGITVVALVFLFGIYSIADGLITIVRAIRDREHLSSWGWWVFTGVVSVGAGIVALVWPGITALVLLYIIAFYAIMFGIFGIVGAFKMKRCPDPVGDGCSPHRCLLSSSASFFSSRPAKASSASSGCWVGTQSCSASS